jgi:N6-adenosine-specific RNA methylase IME4
MNELKAINKQLWDKTQEILALKRDVGISVFDLGKLLYEIRLMFQGNSEVLGFTSFNAYLSAPVDSGGVDFERRTAYWFIELYETYTLKLGVAHVPHIDQAKLRMLCPIINQDNMTDWFHKAKVLSRSDLAEEIKEARQGLKDKLFAENPYPEGRYRTIIIDPPWPNQKIEREERPNQKDWDYPSLSIEEIKKLPVSNLADSAGSHIYLWTTHKYLPISFEILKAWNVEYQCLLTWVKNVGITPYSWMYSTEHILFGRIGNLDLLIKGLRLDFQGKVREHSRKPESFYELVKVVSPKKRLDMFSREERNGYETWGSEKAKFQTG